MEVSESEETFQGRKCLVSIPVAAVVHDSVPGKGTLDFQSMKNHLLAFLDTWETVLLSARGGWYLAGLAFALALFSWSWHI